MRHGRLAAPAPPRVHRLCRSPEAPTHRCISRSRIQSGPTTARCPDNPTARNSAAAAAPRASARIGVSVHGRQRCRDRACVAPGRMAFAKVVMNIESAHFPNHAFARFIHAQPTQRAAYQLVWTADRSLRAREGCRRRSANGSRRQACSIRHNASKSHGAASSINACDTSLMRTSAFRSRRSSRTPLALSATTVRRRSFLSMRVLTNPCA